MQGEGRAGPAGGRLERPALLLCEDIEYLLFYLKNACH